MDSIIGPAKKARELFNSIQEELDEHGDDFKEGLSYLDMKNDTLLSYMVDVCNIMLRKLKCESIEDHQSVERSIQYRIILEKIKSIDRKLAYQLNKLITLPDDAVEEDNRVDIKNLDINIEAESEQEGDEEDEDEDGDENEDEDEDGSDTQSSTSSVEKTTDQPVGVYKPPKLRSVAYVEEGDHRKGNSGRRRNHDDFYRDQDDDDIVEETRPDVDTEREKYEEDNFTRLRPEKKAKKGRKKFKPGGSKRRKK